jgi:hypothetical protein
VTKLVAIPVTTPEQVDQMRLIYNECRPFLATKPLPERTYEEQQEWWASLPKTTSRVKAFLYESVDKPGETVAFSMLQWKLTGRTTPIFGIYSKARGLGFAREIIQHYLDEAEGPLYGEMLASHEAIVKMNWEVGWQKIEERDGVIYLYHPNPQRSYPDYAGMLEYWNG